MVGKITPDDKCTCSNLFYIMGGVSKWSTPNKVLDQCIRAKNGENVRTAQNSVQEVGDALESTVAELTAKRLGLTNLDTQITIPVKHKDLPLWGSLDATAYADNLTIEPDTDADIYTETGKPMFLQGKGVIEIKCTADWPSEDGVPQAFRGLIQAKGQMACSADTNWAVIATLYRSTLLQIYVMLRDDEFEERLAAKVLDFDHRIQTENYFPAFSQEDTAMLYPTPEPGLSVDLSSDDCGYHLDRIYDNQTEIKKLTDEINESQTYIQDVMGQAERGGNDRFAVTWGSITYKPKPEKIVPASDGYTNRRKSVTIKKLDL